MRIKSVIVGLVLGLAASLAGLGFLGTPSQPGEALPCRQVSDATTTYSWGACPTGHVIRIKHPILSTQAVTQDGTWELICTPTSETTGICWIKIVEGRGY